MKLIIRNVWFVFTVLVFSAGVHAESLTMKGSAIYQDLGKNYYLATYSVGEKSRVNGFTEKKLSIKVLAKRWSPRKWHSHWQNGISINNPLEDTSALDPQLLADIELFSSMPQTALVRDDLIEVHAINSFTTSVKVNGHEFMSSKGKDLFNIVANSWWGQLPPSREFREQILGEVAGPKNVQDLLAPSTPGGRDLLADEWNAAIAKNHADHAEAQRLELAQQKQAEVDAARKAEEARLQKQAKLAAKQEKATQKYWADQYHWKLSERAKNLMTYPIDATALQQQGLVKIRVTVDKRGILRRHKNLSKEVSSFLVDEVIDKLKQAGKEIDRPKNLKSFATSFNYEFKFDLNGEAVNNYMPPAQPDFLVSDAL